MADRTRRVIRKIACPEGKGETSLLVEWETEKGRKKLRSVSCDNPKLMDYSGEDCDWQCWERISKEKQ
jgi:hypothetical protein